MNRTEPFETFSVPALRPGPLAERPMKDIDGVLGLQRACTDECGFVHWGNPTPAVGAIVEHEGEIILARNAGWPPGFFALVTGYLEAKEDPMHAVVREVKEELDLDVVETNLVGNYIFERKNEVMLCYHAVATGTVKLGTELAGIPPPQAREPPALEARDRARGRRLDALARPRLRMGRAPGAARRARPHVSASLQREATIRASASRPTCAWPAWNRSPGAKAPSSARCAT